jgi:hypothetical protein
VDAPPAAHVSIGPACLFRQFRRPGVAGNTAIAQFVLPAALFLNRELNSAAIIANHIDKAF